MFLPSTLDRLAIKTLRALGYTLVKQQHLTLAPDRRKRLLDSHCIDLVIDVGANTGQYGKSLREIGYKGRIASFEPMSRAFRDLLIVAQSDGNWETHQFGLGDNETTADLHISGNSISSSLLPMLPSHEKFAPRSRYIENETVHIKRLDDIIDEIMMGAKHIWLKLDVQGYEDRVLHGAHNSLKRIQIIQIELSFRPLYANQASFITTTTLLDTFGYDLVGLEPGFMDYSTGELLQADGIFLCRER